MRALAALAAPLLALAAVSLAAVGTQGAYADGWAGGYGAAKGPEPDAVAEFAAAFCSSDVEATYRGLSPSFVRRYGTTPEYLRAMYARREARCVGMDFLGHALPAIPYATQYLYVEHLDDGIDLWWVFTVDKRGLVLDIE